MEKTTKKNRNLFLIFIVLSTVFILWVFISRNIFSKQHVLSTRYYSSVLVFIIPLASVILYTIKEISQKRFFWAISLLIIPVQLFLCFTPFRDLYISDTNAIIQEYLSKTDLIAIPQKENLRIPAKSFRFVEYLSAIEDTNQFLENYRYWGHDIILILKKNRNDSLSALSYPQGTSHQVLSKLKTNKKGGSYSIVKYSPKKHEEPKSISLSPENVLKNSDLEIQQDLTEICSKFKKWADEGAVFYETPHPLPQYIELPNQMQIKEIPFYPIAYSESESPIQGKSSLHVIFNYRSHSYYNFHVKLLNRISSQPGNLSFYVKSVKPNSRLIVSKIENDSHGRWIATEPNYHFFLKDEQTYFVSFVFDSFSSLNTMFLLQGVCADVILDCIQYIPF